MSNRKLVQSYYEDINCLADLLGKLVNSYRLLIGGAGELNQIALATKSDVKHAITRINRLGGVIDNIITDMDDLNEEYIKYCKYKSELIKGIIGSEFVQNEIEEQLKR